MHCHYLLAQDQFRRASDRPYDFHGLVGGLVKFEGAVIGEALIFLIETWFG